MITVGNCLKSIEKLIGRKVRACPEVNIWGDIYNRKKVGTVHRIEVDGFFGVSVWITFRWKSMKGYQQNCLRFPFKNVQWEISEAEDSLGRLF